MTMYKIVFPCGFSVFTDTDPFKIDDRDTVAVEVLREVRDNGCPIHGKKCRSRR